MARPFTASDDEILAAGTKVLNRRGPNAFSIAEVASEVGLSRAAIILRFKSTRALKVTLLTQQVERFATLVATLPQSPSGENLLRVAAFIGGHIGSRENSARFFAEYFSANVRDPELFGLERKRGDALGAAIARVMPAVAIDHAAAVLAFRSHLTGSFMAWLALDDVDARHYIVSRTGEWLKLAGIPVSEQLIAELAAVPADSPGNMPGRSNARRSSTPRIRKSASRA